MKNKLLSICFSLILSVVSSQLSVVPTYAATAPSPKPCEDALLTDKLAKTVTAPIEQTLTATGKPGQSGVTVKGDFRVQIDFSALASLFANSNSNYYESNYQDESHRQKDLLNADSTEIFSYFGPGQRTASKVMIDPLKENYVKYVYEKPGLPEASNKYANISGENPKTVYDLVQEFGLPNPPEGDQDRSNWMQSWGQYWDKIPTAVSEVFYGKLVFGFAHPGQSCPQIAPRVIYFVMPEFYRTTSLTNQLNLTMVPSAAQSTLEKSNEINFFEGTLGSAADKTKSLASKIFELCIKPFTESPLAKAIQKAVKISLDFLTIVKPAYAAQLNPGKLNFGLPETCPTIIPIQTQKPKEGNAPFCSLPERAPSALNFDYPHADGELQLNRALGEGCQDKPSRFKLDNGANVICTFVRQFERKFTLKTSSTQKDEYIFDTCTSPPDTNGNITCSVVVKMYPTFYIPWIGQVWNNTTYSDSADADQFKTAIFGTPQKTGRTGFLSIGKPGVLNDVICDEEQKLPGKVAGNQMDLKERYSGCFDCSKHFVRDVALKPGELQRSQNIQTECDLTAAAIDDGGGTVTPGTGCGSGSTFSSLLPNPIPASAGAVSPQLFPTLDSGQVIPAAKSAETTTGTPCELLVGLHYVESSWIDSGSFISGRTIGTPEPDVTSPSACSAYGGSYTAGGCVFSSLQQTANYAGDLIQNKVALLKGEQRPPRDFDEMIGAMSYYNGGGNSNCGESVPYTGPCPPPIGTDDPYAMSHFNQEHSQMYLIYCGDFTRCGGVTPFTRDGAATAAKEFLTRPSN